MGKTTCAAVFGHAYHALGRGRDEPDDLSALGDPMARVRSLVRDPDRSTFRVVTIPEPMAVAEARRLVAQLRAFDVPVTTVVVHRVLATFVADCERCRVRAGEHQAQLDAIRAWFPDLSIVELPEYPPDAGARDCLSALDPLSIDQWT